jgi:hypothetical protein
MLQHSFWNSKEHNTTDKRIMEKKDKNINEQKKEKQVFRWIHRVSANKVIDNIVGKYIGNNTVVIINININTNPTIEVVIENQ